MVSSGSTLGLLLGWILFACWGFLCSLSFVEIERVVKRLGLDPSADTLTSVLASPKLSRKIVTTLLFSTITLWLLVDLSITVSSGSLWLFLSVYVLVRLTALLFGQHISWVLLGNTVKESIETRSKS